MLFEGFRVRGVVFADAAGDGRVLGEAILAGEAVEFVADGLYQLREVRDFFCADDDDEFITADARADRASRRGRKDVADDLGRRLEQFVAFGMAEEVVRFLQPVHVEEQHGVMRIERDRFRRIEAAGARQEARQHVLERHALVEAAFLRLRELAEQAVDVREDDGQQKNEQPARDETVRDERNGDLEHIEQVVLEHA